MNIFVTALLAFCCALTAPGLAQAQEKISHGRFKDISLYRPKGDVKSFAILLSGEAGWTPAMAAMARPLVERGALVAGISTPQLLALLEKDGGDCALPDGDFENLSHFLQGYARLKAYYPPLLVGQASGASLAYALLAQAPEGTFAGALSVGFCPELPFSKPLCKGEGIHFRKQIDKRALTLLPAGKLRAPWIALHGSDDPVCEAKATQAFVAQVPGAELVLLPGADHGVLSGKGALPAYQAAFRQLTAGVVVEPLGADSGIADLPLVEVPSSVPSDAFAVLVSGDGGWAGLDKKVAAVMAARGVPVVGLDSLRYFWKQRTPQGLASDLDRLLRHYAVQWKKSRVVLIGYSQGADVLPFALNRMSSASRSLVAHTVLIGPGEKASFEFKLSNWVVRNHLGLWLKPELASLSAATTTCLYGSDDRDTICPTTSTELVTPVQLKGDHHFGGNYELLAEQILQQARVP
ncbi:MAG TPA: AcvB/VirJ family lysyl-phosphatidylglycerol hydrolase [Ramlibacter sp.]|nr:AcvB/VirJ family lysyl-phosphatidylglycerol hydrolase [Ramlibacter sp.]